MKYTPEPVEYFLLAMLLMIFFSMWNGLVNKQMFNDKTDEQKRATSNMWHFVGALIRVLLGFIAILSEGITGLLWSFIFVLPIYNWTINIIRSLPYNHYGDDFFDKWNKKLYLDYIIITLSPILLIIDNFIINLF